MACLGLLDDRRTKLRTCCSTWSSHHKDSKKDDSDFVKKSTREKESHVDSTFAFDPEPQFYIDSPYLVITSSSSTPNGGPQTRTASLVYKHVQ